MTSSDTEYNFDCCLFPWWILNPEFFDKGKTYMYVAFVDEKIIQLETILLLASAGAAIIDTDRATCIHNTATHT